LCDFISKEERIVTVLCVFCRYFNSPLADVKIQSSNGMFTFDVLHCTFCTNCVRLLSLTTQEVMGIDQFVCLCVSYIFCGSAL